NIPIKVDTRVIAATNRTLEDEVAAGRFREDLFYRLNVIRIHMPPLRERREDIAMLVGHFLDKHRFGATAAPAKLSESAMRAIENHDWPGNVRQLENIIQRAVVLAQGGVITTEHLVLDPTPERKIIDIEQLLSRKVPLKDIVGEVERAAIGEALRQAHGNRSKAANMLGIYRRLLYAKMREHGLLNEGEQPPEDEEPETPTGSPVSA
ncbi:MAG: sigma-54-dependent Fis family transcriptional regulator, partial [Chloroflexi bacterium]|nr:sigma-54-dependent Fis family transcriptional regulator [Chloroflexota bacterium]